MCDEPKRECYNNKFDYLKAYKDWLEDVEDIPEYDINIRVPYPKKVICKLVPATLLERYKAANTLLLTYLGSRGHCKSDIVCDDCNPLSSTERSECKLIKKIHAELTSILEPGKNKA